MIEIEIPKGIKNIIFDLGGVILNIDYKLTAKAFEKLGFHNFDDTYSQQKQLGLFDDLETGKISKKGFLDQIKAYLPGHVTDKDITSAWNAMLLNLPKERVKHLNTLKHKYRIFLLSNTNQIHEEAFSKLILKENGIHSFDEIFERVYYSHKIGFRKPNKDCFQYVMESNKLNPNETLFVDDSIQHVEGANKLGIKTIFYS